VDSVLVVGVETVVGGNLAATLASTNSVSVISRDDRQSWAFGPFAYCPRQAAAAHYVRIRQQAPRQIVYCGNGARSCWDGGAYSAEAETLAACLDAAKALSAGFTLISSDGVLTGPWMFHAENSQSLCPSMTARLLRDAEAQVSTDDPRALIVRTHAYGWSPLPDAATWLNRLLTSLTLKQPQPLDAVSHASPILASDLGGILMKAWQAGLNGLYHVAGAERTSPAQFAQRLALQWGTSLPVAQETISLDNLPAGFGRGETSLQTRKIRRALGIGMPLLNEGILRLHAQQFAGYDLRLQGARPVSRAA